MVRDTRHVIAVPNLTASAEFYRDVLGFEIREIGDGGWRMYVQGACHILAGECPDALPPRELGDHSYFLYLVVDDATAYHARVAKTGTEIVKALADEPWGMREFGLRTRDGHRIMVGEAI
jgi:uncharacterized glyoxalase superfamily protein PhnB